MADSPLLKKLRNRARDLGNRAVDELFASESRSEAVGAAVRTAQRGKRVLDERSARLVGALGLANRDDLDRVNRKIGRLRKRLAALLDSLDD